MTDVVDGRRLQSGTEGKLIRALDWKGAFWVAAGVPPLVLFSIGGIAGTTGKLAFVVWIISMVMGFLQSFTYAEIAGMFGNKSGGASVYGATAWLRYSKFIAPLSVWCNWFAWSPVLSLGCAIAAGYILNAFFPIPGRRFAGGPRLDQRHMPHRITADSPRVAEWLAANAGKTPQDADHGAAQRRRRRRPDAGDPQLVARQLRHSRSSPPPTSTPPSSSAAS